MVVDEWLVLWASWMGESGVSPSESTEAGGLSGTACMLWALTLAILLPRKSFMRTKGHFVSTRIIFSK